MCLPACLPSAVSVSGRDVTDQTLTGCTAGPLSVRLARDNNFVSAYVADARRAGLRVEQAESDKDRNGRGRGSRSLSPLSDEEGPAPMAVDGDNTTASHTHDPKYVTAHATLIDWQVFCVW